MDPDIQGKGDRADERGTPESDDPRRDPMAPPKEPCECWCLHCGRTFMSDQMWFQRVIGDPQGFPGFWMCPTPNCDGAGFCFDIFPTDPSHPANEGWVEDDDADDHAEAHDEADPEWQAEYEEIAAAAAIGGEANADAAEEWDPEEPKYKALDQEFGDDDDDDIEGEEWKYGLEPGERPPEPDWASNARREWEEE